MEIRNNPPQCSTPAFGMALLKPRRILLNSAGTAEENIDRALSHFENTIYGGKKSKLMTRALRQYIGHQQNNPYNIEYVAEGKTKAYKLYVTDKVGNVVAAYDKNTKHVSPADQKLAEIEKKLNTNNKLKRMLYCLRGFFITVKEPLKIVTVKPEALMPAPFKVAAETANELNKAALQREKNVRTVTQIFDENSIRKH